MTYKYSLKNNAFYPVKMLDRYKKLPDDLIDVTNEEYINLYLNLDKNKRLSVKDGKLVVVSKKKSKKEKNNEFTLVMDGVTTKYIDDLIRGKHNFQSLGDYVGYPNKFRKLAESLGKWKAEVWFYTEKQIELLNKGERDIVTPEEYLEELPKFKIK